MFVCWVVCWMLVIVMSEYENVLLIGEMMIIKSDLGNMLVGVYKNVLVD